MTGEIVGDEALIRLQVTGPEGNREVRFVIDTGFTEEITLPPDVVAELGLPYQDTAELVLADGSGCNADTFDAGIVWHGEELPVIAVQTEGDSLLGMSLLRGSRLSMDVLDGSAVSVERLQGL